MAIWNQTLVNIEQVWLGQEKLVHLKIGVKVGVENLEHWDPRKFATKTWATSMQ